MGGGEGRGGAKLGPGPHWGGSQGQRESPGREGRGQVRGEDQTTTGDTARAEAERGTERGAIWGGQDVGRARAGRAAMGTEQREGRSEERAGTG